MYGTVKEKNWDGKQHNFGRNIYIASIFIVLFLKMQCSSPVVQKEFWCCFQRTKKKIKLYR